MSKSRINLIVEFDATADTEPFPAPVIAELVKDFLAAQLDAANTTVKVDGAFLVYVQPYEARKAEVEQARKDALS